MLPALPTGASTGLPADGGPPAGAPASAGPLASVEAAVDLTPATPRVFDGERRPWRRRKEARTSVPPADADLAQRVVTVAGPRPGRDRRSVEMPRAVAVWGMHVLPSGEVVVAGDLADGSTYGAVVVDPVTGGSRTTPVVIASDDRLSANGKSVIAGSSSSSS